MTKLILNCVPKVLCVVLLCSDLFAQTDQTLEWATYYGGADSDFFQAAAKNPNGGYIIVGLSSSPSGMTTQGSHQPGAGGGTGDGLIVSMNDDKSLNWSSYYGGNGYEIVTDVDVKENGEFVIAGLSNSTNQISTPDALIELFPGGEPSFVALFNENGQRIWGTYFGGTNENPFVFTAIKGVQFDPEGNIVIAGDTQSAQLPVSEGAHQSTYGGGLFDGFVAKLSVDGSLMWCTYFGGESRDQVADVVVLPSGDIVVSGQTQSLQGIASENGYQTANGGGDWDAFIASFSSGGDLNWGTYFGGEGDETMSLNSKCMGEDGNGAIYIAGVTTSEEGIATEGAHSETLNHNARRMIASFASDGSLLWGSYFGGAALGGGARASFVQNQLIVFGSDNYGFDLVTGNPYQSSLNATGNSVDLFVTGFTSSGAQLWGTYYGGSGSEIAHDIIDFADGQIMVVGHTRSNNLPVTADSWQSELGNNLGLESGFLAIFEIDGLTSIEHNEELKLKAYPNPTTQHLWLDLPPSFAFHAEVNVYNSVGQLVQRHTQFSSHEPLSLQHPPGLYIVEARKGDNAVRAKVVVR